MKRFKNCTTNRDIDEAIAIAEMLLLPDSKMMKELRQKNDWKFNSGNGERVVSELSKPRNVVSVFTYRPFNFFTSAIAFRDAKGIHFNSLKISQTDITSKIGTLLHEFAHEAGFGHGNNFKNQEKIDFSVSYFLSENVEKWI
jgi:hypothetical protein